MPRGSGDKKLKNDNFDRFVVDLKHVRSSLNNSSSKPDIPSQQSAKVLHYDIEVDDSMSTRLLSLSLRERRHHRPPWNELTSKQKMRRALRFFIIFLKILGALYCFFFGIELMGTAFALLGGKGAGSLFDFINNPIAGLMVGISATAIIQSSSTTTSIVVALVSSGAVSVQTGIPIVMGANIGTSVTNTIVSLAHLKREDKEFERAFSGATIHDVFNVLSVFVLLPLEIASQYLYYFSGLLADAFVGGKGGSFQSPIKLILSLLTDLFLTIDKDKLQQISEGQIVEGSLVTGGAFINTNMSDTGIAIVSLLIALVVLVFGLLALVRVLSQEFSGTASRGIQNALSFNNYLSMLAGFAITAVIQSSSVVTATLVPLVALGIITLEQAFPLTVGANLGTTVTAILAAISTGESTGLQIALSHLLFNVSGMLVWFVIPFMRAVPLEIARCLGFEIGRNRWFAAVYILVLFFLIPALLLVFSAVNIEAVIVVAVIIVIALVSLFCLLYLRRNKPAEVPRWCALCKLPPEEQVFDGGSDIHISGEHKRFI